jgi:hypothetical protein
VTRSFCRSADIPILPQIAWSQWLAAGYTHPDTPTKHSVEDAASVRD